MNPIIQLNEVTKEYTLGITRVQALCGICRNQENRESGLAQNPASVQGDMESIQALNGNFARLAAVEQPAGQIAALNV